MRLAIIVALDEDNLMGNSKKNSLPWHIPEDLRNFKKLTSYHTVIMGKRTFESIGKPLSNRRNIVLSSSASFTNNHNILVTQTLDDAIFLAKKENEEIAFIIGGKTLYEEGVKKQELTDIYLTRVHHHFNLPQDEAIYLNLPLNKDWKREQEEIHQIEINGENVSFSFFHFIKKLENTY